MGIDYFFIFGTCGIFVRELNLKVWKFAKSDNLVSKDNFAVWNLLTKEY